MFLQLYLEIYRGGEWYFKTMDGSGTIFVEFLGSRTLIF